MADDRAGSRDKGWHRPVKEGLCNGVSKVFKRRLYTIETGYGANSTDVLSTKRIAKGWSDLLGSEYVNPSRARSDQHMVYACAEL